MAQAERAVRTPERDEAWQRSHDDHVERNNRLTWPVIEDLLHVWTKREPYGDQSFGFHPPVNFGNYVFTVEAVATLGPLDRPGGISGGEVGAESGGSGSDGEPSIGGGDPPRSGGDDPSPSEGDEPPLAHRGAA